MYLIKFNFTNPKLVPRWVAKKDRKNDKQLDAKHAFDLKSDGDPDSFRRAQVGLHRQDRVDTGLTPGQEKMVTAGLLHKTMSLLGHKLVDVHYYVHDRQGRMKKFVLVLAYEDNKPALRLGSDQVRDLKWFQNQVWEYCHLWINPEAGNITINFTNRKPEEEAKIQIGYRGNSVAFEPIPAGSRGADEPVQTQRVKRGYAETLGLVFPVPTP